MDEPLDQNGDEDDGFAVEEEPALLDMISSQSRRTDTVVSPRHSGGMAGGMGGAAAEPAKPKDVWDLGADFMNIDNLKGNVVKKKASAREEVSMSMMRGMQPFGGGGASSARLLPASSRPHLPPAASPFFGAPAAGMNAFAGMPGMGGGFPGGHMGQMGGQMGGQLGGHMGGHMGGQMGAPMGMAGASPFGMPQGFGGGQACRCSGGGGGGGMAFGGMGGFGGAPASAPPTNDLPFAAAPSRRQPHQDARQRQTARVRRGAGSASGAGQQQAAAMPQSALHGPVGPNWNR